MAVSVHHRPIAMNPDARKSRPVGLQVTFFVFPETSRLADPWFADDKLSDRAANRIAVFINHVSRDAGAWRRKRARFDRQQGIAHQDSAGDFGSARVIDDRYATPPHVFKQPPPWVRVPGF